jgi:hypothetical protein
MADRPDFIGSLLLEVLAVNTDGSPVMRINVRATVLPTAEFVELRTGGDDAH